MAEASVPGPASLPQVIKEEFLTCKICLEAFQRPKILVCLHTFCQKCLTEHEHKNGIHGTLLCPICRQMTPVPEGVEALRDNFYIMGLLDAVNTQSTCEVINAIFCDSCRGRNEQKSAIKRCLQCQEYMCADCLSAHQRLTLTKYHMTVSCDELQPENGGQYQQQKLECKVHLGEKADWYCDSCTGPICLICKSINHNHHALVPVKEAERRERENLRKLVATLQSQAKRYQKLLGDWQSYGQELEQTAERSNTTMVQRQQDLVNLVQRWYENLKNHKQEVVDLERVAIQEKQDTIAAVLNKYHMLINIIDSSLTYASTQQILEVSESVHLDSEMEKLEEINCGVFKLALQHKLNVHINDIDLSFTEEKLGTLLARYERVDCSTISPIQILKFVRKFETRPSLLPSQYDAFGISVNQNDDIIVADRQLDRVAIFSKEGTKSSEINVSHSGRPLSCIQLVNSDLVVIRERMGACIMGDNGKDKRLIKDNFSKPCHITMTNTSNFMVLDYDFKTISIFSSTDYTRLSRTKIHYKNKSVWDKIAMNHRGDIYLLVHKENCIYQLNHQGSILDKHGQWGSEDAGDLYWPKGMCIDRYDNLIVADSMNSRLQMLTLRGTWVILQCPKDCTLQNPTDVTVNSDGVVCVLESSGTVKMFNYIP